VSRQRGTLGHPIPAVHREWLSMLCHGVSVGVMFLAGVIPGLMAGTNADADLYVMAAG